MKKFLVLFIGSVLLTSLALSQGTFRFTEQKLKQIDENLVLSLQSDIPGIVSSALKTVRDVKAAAPDYSFSHNMVISLMRIVKNEEESCPVRILAAFALNDMDSEVGNYAIKMQTRFSDSPRVRNVCSWLAYNRYVEKELARLEKLEGTKSIATTK